MRTLALVAVLVGFGSQASLADSICPPPPASEDADDLRMPESVFTQKACESALHVLKLFPSQIVTAADLPQTVHSAETWIGYMNSLRIVEGWVLKAAALHEMTLGQTNGPAVKSFCDFVATAHYDDWNPFTLVATDAAQQGVAADAPPPLDLPGFPAGGRPGSGWTRRPPAGRGIMGSRAARS